MNVNKPSQYSSNSSIKFVNLNKNVSLGEAKNIAISNASGSYIAQWDDDDFHHPKRLEYQYKALQESGRDFSLISRWRLVDVRNKIVKEIRYPLEGTILSRKSKMLPYPHWTGREDSVLLHRMWVWHRTLIPVNNPDLYYYVYHGNNTSPYSHFQDILSKGYSLNNNLQNKVLSEVNYL
jgi:glycosyltransferase involved in cell wall biosynthesis